VLGKMCTVFWCFFPRLLSQTFFKGNVQQKLTWVKSGINGQLMICHSVAWYLFLNLKSLGPLNLKKRFSAD
jgi:hypothetical protein